MGTAEFTTPTAIHTILFATDFSESAKRAQSYATGMANRFRANLIVAHANDLPNYGQRPENWRAANEGAAGAMRQIEREMAAAHPAFHAEFHVDEGTTWQMVESVLEREKVDLIVMGTRGRTGVGKFLLGSQAEEVFRRATCPVLTVGPHAPLMSGRENELNEVLFATDFSPAAQNAAPFAVSIALMLQAHLNLLHVAEEPKMGELVIPEEVLTSSRRLLRSLVPEEAQFWREPRYFAERGEPVEKILVTAESVRAGLIVLGVRKPGPAAANWGTGVAYKVACSATCPVVTVRGWGAVTERAAERRVRVTARTPAMANS
jgi:nucleotide-binding universal stress UspA family protein